MAIGKLVSEATAIDKLYLMPRDWASARRIRYLRGISATAIDRAKQEVRTDQGESIPYDRLLLATGAQSFVPEIEGFGLEGTFVLKDDRRRRPGPAVHPPPELPACPDHRWRIARPGGGAQHYRAGGLRLRTQPQRVAVEPPARPPRRHAPRKIDARLRHSHTALGEPRRIFGTERVEGVVLSDGRKLGVILCLVATGIRPNVELARESGLAVRRGVVVDDRMMTSDLTSCRRRRHRV